MPHDIFVLQSSGDSAQEGTSMVGRNSVKPADAFMKYPPMLNKTAAKQVDKRTIRVKLGLRGGRAAALIGSTARAPTIAVMKETGTFRVDPAGRSGKFPAGNRITGPC
jgi:hypothetical protein